MSGTPKWKVYDSAGKYEAACRHGEIAAAVVGILGDGATIKYDHGLVLWTEGKEEFSASESYDQCLYVMDARKIAHARASIDKAYGSGTAAKWEAERAAR